MKSMVLLCAGAAAVLFVPLQVGAAGGSSPWRTAQDRAICDPIFSKLKAAEGGLLMAEADVSQSPAKSEANQKDKPSEEELTNQLSVMLQACSYDGKAVTVKATAINGSAGLEGKEAIDKIMRFTGLPQNFTIIESDVPNAAAVIVLGDDGVPRRIIAYSREFMKRVAEATGQDSWPGTSILAHEIGHHLSGHTLMAGGSQPPTELEADKFSGFVLFKMGATLPEAEKAIAALIPATDGPTHPGRDKRLKALQAGWLQSCEQQQENCGGNTLIAKVEPRLEHLPAATEQQIASQQPAPTTLPASAPAQAAAAPMPNIPGPLDIEIPSPGGVSRSIGPAVVDSVARLQADATPSKFDRFIYDEIGVFDPAVRHKLQQTAFQFAAATNVEVVTVVAKDLQGRDPDQYALDFMRQMRVGKMDVGNGAVLVVAPNSKQVGLALGPGLRVLFENDPSPRKRLTDFLEIVAGGGQPQRASSTIADAAYRIMSQAKALEWAIRYPSLAAYLDADRKVSEERAKATTAYDPSRDPVANKLLRLEATLITGSPDSRDRKLMVNEPRSRQVGPAMQVRTPEGEDIVLYVNPNVQVLMPLPLKEGQRYSFVARDTILKTGVPQLDLISYDLLE